MEFADGFVGKQERPDITNSGAKQHRNRLLALTQFLSQNRRPAIALCLPLSRADPDLSKPHLWSNASTLFSPASIGSKPKVFFVILASEKTRWSQVTDVSFPQPVTRVCECHRQSGAESLSMWRPVIPILLCYMCSLFPVILSLSGNRPRFHNPPALIRNPKIQKALKTGSVP